MFKRLFIWFGGVCVFRKKNTNITIRTNNVNVNSMLHVYDLLWFLCLMVAQLLAVNIQYLVWLTKGFMKLNIFSKPFASTIITFSKDSKCYYAVLMQILLHKF